LAQEKLVGTARAAAALVERVVDGDTLVVRLDGQSVKVRLIGVDAPESVDPRRPVQRFARESHAGPGVWSWGVLEPLVRTTSFV
jgi:endonuclease YncB( thermonuclease family)